MLILLALAAGQAAWHVARSRPDPTSSAQRIYATLVRWGADVSGITPPVDEAEVQRYVTQLRSDDSEARVRAAYWLADRGLRDQGERIAASMGDPGTLRPCQLAHSLGKLGDERWVDDLLAAAAQPENTDLRACAALALGDLASADAVDALIGMIREDPSNALAIGALGEIGDPRALEHLRWLERNASDAGLRKTVETAIERVELLGQPDPTPALLGRVERSLDGRRPDTWALRHLARRADARSLEPLSRWFAKPGLERRHRELLAAALLAHGPPGREALAHAHPERAAPRAIAASALSL